MWHQASLESLWAVNTWRQKTIPNPVNAIIDVATAAATASNERSSMARLAAMSLSLRGGLAHGDTDVSERSVLPPSITSSGQPQNPLLLSRLPPSSSMLHLKSRANCTLPSTTTSTTLSMNDVIKEQLSTGPQHQLPSISSKVHAEDPLKSSLIRRHKLTDKLQSKQLNTWHSDFRPAVTVAKSSSLLSMNFRGFEIPRDTSAKGETEGADRISEANADGTDKWNHCVQPIRTPPPSRISSGSRLPVALARRGRFSLAEQQMVAKSVPDNDKVDAAAVKSLPKKRSEKYRRLLRRRSSAAATEVSSGRAVDERIRKYYKTISNYGVHLATAGQATRQRRRPVSVNDDVVVVLQPEIELQRQRNDKEVKQIPEQTGKMGRPSQRNDENFNENASVTALDDGEAAIDVGVNAGTSGTNVYRTSIHETDVVVAAEGDDSPVKEQTPPQTTGQENGSKSAEEANKDEEVEEEGTEGEEQSSLSAHAAKDEITKTAAADKMIFRRCIAEDLSWSLKVVKNLDTIALEELCKSFSEDPSILLHLMPGHRSKVINCLSVELPLPLAVDWIDDESPEGNDYWRRRCYSTWPTDRTLEHKLQSQSKTSRLQPHGIGSWKRLFLERRLVELIEKFIPRLSDVGGLDRQAAIGSRYVRRLDITQLLPPFYRARKLPRIAAPKAPPKPGTSAEDNDGVEDASGDDDKEEGEEEDYDEQPRDHVELQILAKHLTCLKELRISYGVRRTGLNFSWEYYHCTLQDCANLTEFVAASSQLRCLEIHQSRLDDARLLMLMNGLRSHPSLTEIRLPYNSLGDDSARILARHLDDNGSLVTVVDLRSNNIGSEGSMALGFALTKNQSVRHLVLRHNPLGDDGGKYIFQTLRSANKSVKQLDVAATGLTEVATHVIARVFETNSVLTILDLSSNAFGEEGGLRLMESIQLNSTLTELDLRSCGCGVTNEFYVWKKLHDNRRALHLIQLKQQQRQHHRHNDDDDDDDEEEEEEEEDDDDDEDEDEDEENK